MRNRRLNGVYNSVLAGDLTTLKLAIAGGEDVNERNRTGGTPLFESVIAGRKDLVEELIRNGANVNVADNAGKTPLHLAAIHFRPDCAEALLKSSATVDPQDNHGNTPLSNAVFYSKGRGDIIKLLLEYGANPGLPNVHGVTPSSLANTIANYEVAKFLR